MSIEPGDLDRLADRILGTARTGEEVEAFVSAGWSTTVRAHGGDIESFESATTLAVGVRVIEGGRQGFAHCGSHEIDAVEAAIVSARDNARYAEPDPHVGLATDDGVRSPELDLWSDAVEAESPEGRIDAALELERLVTSSDDRICGVRTATYRDGGGARLIASTTGLRAYDRGTSVNLSVTALGNDDDKTTTGHGWQVARGPEGFDVASTAKMAADEAIARIGAVKPASARTTAVFDPMTTGTVLSVVGGMLTADRVQRGRSPFADRIGERVGSPLVTLLDDPTDPDSFGADHVDGEGLASRPLTLIDQGALEAFAYDSYTARRGGTCSTASAVRGARTLPSPSTRALTLRLGSDQPADLIAAVGSGVYVTSLTGVHSGVNAISGDFSVGMEGFMIRDGEVAEPIREATLGGTVQRMLGSVSHVGSDRTWLPSGTGSCTLAVDDIALSGS